MEIKIEVPLFDTDRGMEYKWEQGAVIKTKVDGELIIIEANREGLVSLANHLLNLAQDSVPAGHKMRFDDQRRLEEGSTDLLIKKK